MRLTLSVSRDWRSIDKKIRFGMGLQVGKKIEAYKFHKTLQKGQKGNILWEEPLWWLLTN